MPEQGILQLPFVIRRLSDFNYLAFLLLACLLCRYLFPNIKQPLEYAKMPQKGLDKPILWKKGLDKTCFSM